MINKYTIPGKNFKKINIIFFIINDILQAKLSKIK